MSRTVRAAAAAGIVACLSVLTLPVSPASAEPKSVSLFDGATPEVANYDDQGAIELGVTFHSDVDGVVSAVRFYKGDKNIGPHTGSLWTESGDLLATAIFKNETESGWQTVTFDKPVKVVADTTYVASYHTSVGFYSVTINAFNTDGASQGPLHVPARGAAFRYGAGFPDQQSPHNYFVDVVFHPASKPEPSSSASPPSASPTASGTATASPPAVPGNGNGGGGGLPVTGTNASIVAGVGLALAAVGFLLVWRHRRRTTRFVA